MTALTLAIAGHAPNTPRNIDALLSDWLTLGAPDKDGYYNRPDRYQQITVHALMTDGVVPPGLKPALGILPYISDTRFEIVTDAISGEVVRWEAAADAVHEVSDPLQTLVNTLADAPNPRLLINWDDADADDERLVQLAHETGKIRVLDLVEGLTEIVPDDPEDPAAEEEPIQEEPPRRQRKPAKKAPEELEEPQEELPDTPVQPQPKPKAAKSPAPPQTAMQITAPVADTYEMPRALAEQILGALLTAADYHNYTDCQNAIRAGKGLEKAERSPLTQELANSAEMLRAVLYGEEPYQSVPTKSNSPSVKPGKVIFDEETQQWNRAGRGRLRAGTRVGMMDENGNVTESV